MYADIYITACIESYAVFSDSSMDACDVCWVYSKHRYDEVNQFVWRWPFPGSWGLFTNIQNLIEHLVIWLYVALKPEHFVIRLYVALKPEQIVRWLYVALKAKIWAHFLYLRIFLNPLLSKFVERKWLWVSEAYEVSISIPI